MSSQVLRSFTRCKEPFCLSKQFTTKLMEESNISRLAFLKTHVDDLVTKLIQLGDPEYSCRSGLHCDNGQFSAARDYPT